MEAGRYIVFFILLTVIQVKSRSDPVNLKLIKVQSRHENPYMVYEYMNSDDKPKTLMKDLNTDTNNDKINIIYINDKMKPNSAVQLYDKNSGNFNTNILAKLMGGFDNVNSKEDDSMNVDDARDDDYDDPTLEDTAKEQAKFMLYNFLRSSPDENEELQDTKQFLREALRARCVKVTRCVIKCKKKPKCPSKCQEKFDEQNLCEPPEPKKCKKNKCGWGKTMPPSWLF